MADPTDRHPPVIKPVLTALLVVGAALRLWQYAANTSLWLDEIALVQNIVERPLWDLLATPLAYAQSAPKGFLLAEKAAATFFGPNEYALRFFPLLCSLGALIVFRRVAERVLVGLAAPVALALFATATPLVFFAAQVKQYSTDVFVAVLLLWIALRLEETADLSRRRAVWAAVAGAAAAWFSQPAVFVIAGLGLFLVVRAWGSFHLDRASWRRVALVLAVWCVSAVGAVAAELATVSPQTSEYMHRFWADAMLPVNALRGREALWPVEHLKDLFGARRAATLAYPAASLYLALTAFGLALLWRRRRDAALFLILPIGLTLAAAAARQYPFADRLILFLLPGFFLAIAETIEGARERVAKLSPILGVAALLALAGPALYRTAPPPVHRIQDLKPALFYMQARRRPGDVVYVYYRGGPSVTFYGARYGLRPDDYVSGGCHLEDTRRYMEEVDRFRGHARVWLVAADISRGRSPTDDLVRYLDAIGARLDSLTVPSRAPSEWDVVPAGVFLYDLSDTARLGKSDARSFPLTTGERRSSRLSCDEGPITVDPARRAARLSSRD